MHVHIHTSHGCMKAAHIVTYRDCTQSPCEIIVTYLNTMTIMNYVNLPYVIATQYKLIHDPPCWCTGFTEIFKVNHVMKKVYNIEHVQLYLMNKEKQINKVRRKWNSKTMPIVAIELPCGRGLRCSDLPHDKSVRYSVPPPRARCNDLPLGQGVRYSYLQCSRFQSRKEYIYFLFPFIMFRAYISSKYITSS